MNRYKLIALATIVALLAAIFTKTAARSIFVDGLIGVAEMTHRVCQDPCSILYRTRFFSWDRFDPTCPQCL
jgi:hypothetical protein